MMPRARVITFGCKVNQSDSEEIARALAARGFWVTESGPADVYVVNTCTVTSTADAKARKAIRRLARTKGNALLVITGCYAERAPETLTEISGGGLVVGNARKAEIPDLISAALGASLGHAECAGRSGTPRTRAFLKLQDGCDHQCAYCIVPRVRGRPRSRPLSRVIHELRQMAARGVPEVVLCGIRLGAYGRETGEATLADVLRALRAIPIPRVRLSSLEPTDVDEALLAEMADHPTLCHHLHLPVQSGDDGVLKEMGRRYTASQFAELVGILRSMWPQAEISADILVGFPGETEQQFDSTVRLVRELGLSRLHVFPFSPRPGTPAAERRDQIPPAVVRQRAEIMMRVGEELAEQAARRWLGRPVRVLIEEGRDGWFTGWTEQYLPIRCQDPRARPGQSLTVTPRETSRGVLVT